MSEERKTKAKTHKAGGEATGGDGGGMPQPSLMTFYQEICNHYRAIDDLRMRLMGLLSLASGAGILVLGSSQGLSGQFGSATGFILLPIGLFGFMVTFGLFLFELRGIQRCAALIEVAKYLEESEDTPSCFRSTHDPVEVFRPSYNPVEAFHLKEIEQQDDDRLTIAATARGTARVIYPTVLAAWAFVALVKVCAALAEKFTDPRWFTWAGVEPSLTDSGWFTWAGVQFTHSSWAIGVGGIVAGLIALGSFVLFFWWSTLIIKKFQRQHDKLADELAKRREGQNEHSKRAVRPL